MYWISIEQYTGYVEQYTGYVVIPQYYFPVPSKMQYCEAQILFL